MNLTSDNKPVFEGFKIEDTEQWRLHDPVVDADIKYFEMKTGGDRMPQRSDLDPLDFKAALSEVGLLEPVYDAAGSLVDARVILLGSKLDSLYGSMTGQLISALPNQMIFVRILQACRHCVAIKKPVVVTADALSENKNYLTITVLYVPMSSDGVSVDRIFLHNQVKSRFAG